MTICQRIARSKPMVFCSSSSLARMMGVVPEPKVVAAIRDAGALAADDGENDDPDNDKDELHVYPLSVVFRCIKLMFLIRNPSEMDKIVRGDSGLLLPPNEHAEFLHKIDSVIIKVTEGNVIVSGVCEVRLHVGIARASSLQRCLGIGRGMVVSV